MDVIITSQKEISKLKRRRTVSCKGVGSCRRSPDRWGTCCAGRPPTTRDQFNILSLDYLRQCLVTRRNYNRHARSYCCYFTIRQNAYIERYRLRPNDPSFDQTFWLTFWCYNSELCSSLAKYNYIWEYF